jgi:hypothetical protein
MRPKLFLPTRWLTQRESARRQLLNELVRSREIYDQEECQGWKMAVRSVARYLNDTDADPRLKMMLLSLGLALEELDYGITHRALEARKLDHRPKESLERFLAKAYVCAIMELLMKGGLRKQEAARRAANAAKAWPHFDGISVTPTTVINWRDDVKAKLASESRDKSYLDHLVESGLELDEGPIEAAQMLMTEGIPFGPRKT